MSQYQASLDALPQEVHATLAGFLPTAACAALARTSQRLRAAYRTAHWQHTHVDHYGAVQAANTGHLGRFEVPLHVVLFPHRYRSIFPSELVEVLYVAPGDDDRPDKKVDSRNEYGPKDMSQTLDLDTVDIDSFLVAAYPALRRIVVPIDHENVREFTQSKLFQLMSRIDQRAQSHLLSLEVFIWQNGDADHDEPSDDDQDNEDSDNGEQSDDGEELVQEEDQVSYEWAYIDHSDIEAKEVFVEYEKKEDREGQNEEANEEREDEIEEADETEEMENPGSDSEPHEEVLSEPSTELWDSLRPYIYHMVIEGRAFPFTLGSPEPFANVTTIRFEMSHHESYSGHMVAHLNSMPQLATVFVRCKVGQTRDYGAKGLRVFKSLVTLAKLKSVETVELTLSYEQIPRSSYTVLRAATAPKHPLAMPAVTHLRAAVGHFDWPLLMRHFDFPTVRANGNAVAVLKSNGYDYPEFLTAECLSYFSAAQIDVTSFSISTVVKLATLVRNTSSGITIKRLLVNMVGSDDDINLLFAHLLEGLTLETPGTEICATVENRFTKAALLEIAKKEPSFCNKIIPLLRFRSELCAAAINLVMAPAAYYERMIESLMTALEGRVHRYIGYLYCIDLLYDFAMGQPALEYLSMNRLGMYGSPRLADVLQRHPGLRQILVSQYESGEGSSTAMTFPGFPPGATVAYTCKSQRNRQLVLDVAQKRVFAGATTGVRDILLEDSMGYNLKPEVNGFGCAAFAGWI